MIDDDDDDWWLMIDSASTGSWQRLKRTLSSERKRDLLLSRYESTIHQALLSLNLLLLCWNEMITRSLFCRYRRYRANFRVCIFFPVGVPLLYGFTILLRCVYRWYTSPLRKIPGPPLISFLFGYMLVSRLEPYINPKAARTRKLLNDAVDAVICKARQDMTMTKGDNTADPVRFIGTSSLFPTHRTKYFH